MATKSKQSKKKKSKGGSKPPKSQRLSKVRGTAAAPVSKKKSRKGK
jgi:hypothetical protein